MRLDGVAFAGCTSPVSYSGLALGSHTFAVRATDTAGNTESPPMQRTWTIATAPGNDNFASAQAISSAVGSVEGSLVGATRESGDPFPADAATVWYTWTAPRAGIAQFGAPNGDVNVYTGTSPASLTPVPQLPANDVAPVRFNAAVGTAYKIVVAGYQTLAYTLAWRLQPTNDDVASPVVLSGSSGHWNGDNLGATGVPSDPAPISERGGASIWFRWTAPATGTLRLDTLGGDASLDTLLAVYTKSPYNDPSYQEMVLRGADDDSGGGGKSLLSLPVYEGTDYLVALDGAGGATGMLALNWQLSVAVAPSAPSVALTSPADGAHVHEIVTLTADANDADGITQVDFLVNGAVSAPTGRRLLGRLRHDDRSRRAGYGGRAGDRRHLEHHNDWPANAGRRQHAARDDDHRRAERHGDRLEHELHVHILREREHVPMLVGRRSLRCVHVPPRATAG